MQKPIFYLIAVFLIAFIFAYYFLFYPSLPKEKFKDIKEGVNSSIAAGKTVAVVSEESKCYWIVPSYDGENYVVEINIYEDKEPKCLGTPIKTETIKVENFVSVENQKCICGKNIKIVKIEGGIKIEGG
jgi:hypothetical protein